MKKYISILILFSLVLSLSSCYEKPNWHDDNLKVAQDYVPQAVLIVGSTSIANAGDDIAFDLHFWSDGPIAKVQLHEIIDAADNIVITGAFEANYDQDLDVHVKTFNYTIPNVDSATVIKLECEVVGENGETGTRSFSLTVD